MFSSNGKLIGYYYQMYRIVYDVDRSADFSLSSRNNEVKVSWTPCNGRSDIQLKTSRDNMYLVTSVHLVTSSLTKELGTKGCATQISRSDRTQGTGCLYFNLHMKKTHKIHVVCKYVE